MDVYIDLWSPRADLPMARRLAEAAGHNAPAALLTLIDGGARAAANAGAAIADRARRQRCARDAG